MDTLLDFCAILFFSFAFFCVIKIEIKKAIEETIKYDIQEIKEKVDVLFNNSR